MTDFELLYRRYAPYSRAIAFKILGRRDEADEVVQEVFLAAMSGLRALREPDAVRGWLATVTVRKAQRRLKRARLNAWIGIDESHSRVASGDASPEQKATAARLSRAIAALPEVERDAWTLRLLDGERLQIVAERAGCSLATAKRRIAAAQLKLLAA